MRALRRSLFLLNMDRTLLVSVLLLSLWGVAMIYSASQSSSFGPHANLYFKQLIWLGLGLAAMLLMVGLSMRLLYAIAYVVYALTLILLLLLTIKGAGTTGANRWLAVGPVHLQPAEIAKVAVVLALARYLSAPRRSPDRLQTLLGVFALTGLPILFILKQPDLGTSLVFGAILLVMLFWAGMSFLYLSAIVSPIINVLVGILGGFNWVPWSLFMVVLFLVVYFSRPPPVLGLFILLLNLTVGLVIEPLWEVMPDYQKRRVTTFLNPEQDALGAGYQIIQSKVAIGSGGITGKGLLQGTQTQLAFLPEQHTDFIFSVVGEELGFIGSMGVLLLFFLVLYRIVRVSAAAQSPFASLIAIGAFAILAFHFFVNVGMAIGMMPVTGLPLPFLSYGGSFLLTSLILVGIVLNVWMRRYELF